MKTILLVLLLAFSFNGYSASNNELLPFTSDGCSMAPDNEFIGNHDWTDCCVEHDKKYWIGGTSSEKDEADLQFKQCLQNKGMSTIESEVFYQAVVYGGSAHINTSWKWGYGWEYSRGYEPITKKELNEAKAYKKLFNLPIKVVTPSLLGKFFGELTSNNCKTDVIKRLSKITGIENKKDFRVVKVDGAAGRDSYQVFIKQCKAGYFFVEFKPSLAPDRCVLNNYFSMPDQIEQITAYGECESFL